MGIVASNGEGRIADIDAYDMSLGESQGEADGNAATSCAEVEEVE